MTLSVLSAFKVLYVIFSIWIENWARLIKSIKTVYIHIHTHTHTHTHIQAVSNYTRGLDGLMWEGPI